MHEVKSAGMEWKGHVPQRRPRDRDLKKACNEFESLVMHELLKGMRRTVEKCDLFHGGQGEEIYESLLDMELAKKLAGLGPNSLAAMLYRQISPENAQEGRGTPEPDLNDPLSLTSLPQWPLEATISSPFGWRKDPIDGSERFHTGLDLSAEAGTSVRAVFPGRVAFSGYREGYGNVVILDHGGDLKTVYAHNRCNTVRQGSRVAQGSPIAEVGSSGRSTGAHLHFEVRRRDEPIDPLSVLETT